MPYNNITILKRNLLAGIDTQHGRPKPVRQSPLGIRLPLLSHMRRRPLLLAVLVILTVHVALARQVIRGVNSLAVIRAVVRPATVSQVRRENKKLAYIPPFSNQVAASADFSIHTCFQLDRNPLLRINPVSLDAVRLAIDGNGHLVAAVDDFQAPIRHVGWVDAEENSQVLDVLDLRVCHGVNVRREATYLLGYSTSLRVLG